MTAPPRGFQESFDDRTARHDGDSDLHPAIHAASHSADAMFLVEEDGTVIWANHAAHELLGSPADSLPGQNLYDRLPTAELELALQGLGLLELGIPTRPAVYHPTRDDGTTRPAEVIAKRAGDDRRQLVVSARPADHAQWVIDEFVRLVGAGPTDTVIDRALAEIVVPWPGHVASVLVRHSSDRGFDRVIGPLSAEVAEAIARCRGDRGTTRSPRAMPRRRASTSSPGRPAPPRSPSTAGASRCPCRSKPPKRASCCGSGTVPPSR